MIVYKTFETVSLMKTFLTDKKELEKVRKKYPPTKYALVLNEIDIQLEIIRLDEHELALG